MLTYFNIKTINFAGAGHYNKGKLNLLQVLYIFIIIKSSNHIFSLTYKLFSFHAAIVWDWRLIGELSREQRIEKSKLSISLFGLFPIN